MHKFNCSIHTWGRQMYDVDIDGSIAYSKGLQKAGVLSDNEQQEIKRGLELVREEWASGKVRFITCAVPRVVRKNLMDPSSPLRTTTRTSLPPTSAACLRLLAGISAASYTRAAAGTIRPLRMLDCGWWVIYNAQLDVAEPHVDAQMREVVHVKEYLRSLIEVCTTRAETEVDVLMPGYTHLQVRSCLPRRRSSYGQR